MALAVPFLLLAGAFMAGLIALRGLRVLVEV